MIENTELEAVSPPLTPPNCNLRGLPFMPLHTERLLDSDMMALSTGEEFKTALRLWCKSWAQEPAASLPDDDRILAHLAGKELPAWRKVKHMALRGFVKCSDGRLYHPVIAAEAIKAMARREEHQAAKDGDNDRKREEREDRKLLFAALRDMGVILPAKGTSTSHLREVAASRGITITVTDGHRVVTVTPTESHKESHKGVTAKTGTGTGTYKKEEAAATPPPRARTRETPPAAPPDPAEPSETPPEPPAPPGPIPDATPNRAAQIAVLLRRNGADPATYPGTKGVETLATDGTTDAQLLAALEIAKQRRRDQGSSQAITVAYLLPIIADLRAGPPGKPSAGAAQHDDWWKSDAGIDRKGRELRLFARPSEDYRSYADRIWQHIRTHGTPPGGSAP